MRTARWVCEVLAILVGVSAILAGNAARVHFWYWFLCMTAFVVAAGAFRRQCDQ